jgi:hypothetical protein
MSVLETFQVNVVHLGSDIYVLWHLLRLFLAIMLPLTMFLGGFLFAPRAPALHVDNSSAADFRVPIPSINLLQTTQRTFSPHAMAVPRYRLDRNRIMTFSCTFSSHRRARKLELFQLALLHPSILVLALLNHT